VDQVTPPTCATDNGALCPKVHLPSRHAACSLSCNIEIKNAWTSTSIIGPNLIVSCSASPLHLLGALLVPVSRGNGLLVPVSPDNTLLVPVSPGNDLLVPMSPITA
jgi:hypothetical protein